MKKYIIFGASKGLGDAFVKGLPKQGDQVWVVSRNRPSSLDLEDGVKRIWIQADLSQQEASSRIANAVAEDVIDVIIYNVGIWEQDGFRDDYNFDHDDPAEISRIIQVNITSTITCIQSLLPNIRKSEAGKIIFIGSTAGLDHTNNSQVSFVASKFGLRGITNALREHVRQDQIAVTCINPGELAAEIPYEEGAEKALSAYDSTRIPVQDILSLVTCVIGLSKAACVKEINIPAMQDANA